MTLPAFFTANWAPFDDRKLYAAVIFSIVLFKIAVLVLWGPGFAPDTGGYTRFAELILQGSDWLTDAGLEDSAMPTTAFRIMGYPVLIALAKLVSVEYWHWIIVIAQMALSTVSLVCISRLVSALGLRPAVGCFCLIAVGISLPLLVDNMILTDSFTTSIFVIVLSENAVCSLRKKPFGIAQSLCFGMLVSLAFLLREGVLVLSILFLIPFLVRCFLVEKHRPTSLLSIVIFFLPILIVSQSYSFWNEARTGHKFVTTGGQTVYMVGLVDAAKDDRRIFSGDDPVDVTAREILSDYSFAENLKIQASLFAQGYVAPELALISKQKYFESWANYPLSMLKMTFGHIREKYATLTFRPFAAVRETGFWVLGERPWGDYSELEEGIFENAGEFILFTGETIERIVAIAITVAFVIVPIVWFVRLCFGKKTNRSEVLVVGALWAVYFGVLFAHALVHVEPRYLAPVVPFSTVIGCLCIQRMLDRRKFKEDRHQAEFSTSSS